MVASNALGNFALSIGMKQATNLLAALLEPWVLGGIALLIFWTLARMALLSWADLSYVLPVTAFGYVLNAAFGRVFLGEQITPARWTGTLLIVAGIMLVGLGNPRTERSK